MKKAQWLRPSKDRHQQMADPRYALIADHASGKCMCRACGDFFSGERTFDTHRCQLTETTHGCHDTAWMRRKGWSRNKVGFWAEKGPDWRKVFPKTTGPKTALTGEAEHGGS